MKYIVNLILFTFLFSFSSIAQIKVLPSGDFAIGQNYITNDDYKVEINGERKGALAISTRHETPWAWAEISKAINGTTKHWVVSLNGYNNHTAWTYTWGEVNAVSYRTWSDASFKQNVRPIEEAENIISLLQPHYYDYKPGFNGSDWYDSAVFTNQPGFIAQELQEVLPNLVNPIDSSGKLGVNYQGLIPVVVQCLKDQSARIEQLENNLATCCNAAPSNERKEQGSTSIDKEASGLENDLINVTEKNEMIDFKIVPNPNKGHFEIEPLDQKVLKAENIMITTLSGELVQNAAINVINNKANVNMSGARSGVYYIHILQSGEVISSKKVVINN